MSDASKPKNSNFADLPLNQSMGLTPPELVQADFTLDQQIMAMLRKDKPVIVGSQQPRSEGKQLLE